jgi:hypothetical protein
MRNVKGLPRVSGVRRGFLQAAEILRLIAELRPPPDPQLQRDARSIAVSSSKTHELAFPEQA